MKVALRIKELRLEKGFTQKQLAEKVGCSASMVTRWEKEECEPTATAIVNFPKRWISRLIIF